jgi:murein DD-endopeptidase MepM/ murein hydrolase activator NlpD
VSGTVAKTLAVGTVALFGGALAASAALGESTGGAAYSPPGSSGDSSGGNVPQGEVPGNYPLKGGSGGSSPTATTPSGPRPVLTIFTASTAAVDGSRPVVQFQVRDRSRRVKVRLAFVNLADGSAYRVGLGSRRTGVTQSFTPKKDLATGSYRVRITARNRAGYRVVRATSLTVSPPLQAPAPSASGHRFPVAGPHSFGSPDARFGAPRTGHTHQGQDIIAAEGTPVVAVRAGRVTWVAYQAGGAGYYVVLAGDGEPYNYVYMHLQEGSVLVRKGDHVEMGQQLGSVGHTGDAEGPHLHFELWDGPWYNGGHAIDPLPLLRQWPGA